MVTFWQLSLTVHSIPFSPSQIIFRQSCWGNCSAESKQNIIGKIWDARKPSTVTKYCQALRKFFSFCSTKSFEICLPINSLFLADYLSHISKSKGTIGAVTSAVTALKWLHSFIPGLNQANDPLNDCFINRIAEGQKRNLIKEKTRKKPLTFDLIKQIFINFSKIKKPSLIQMRDTLIPSLAYALLLRHDEISHLNCSHISHSINGFRFHIPSSKTDIYRQGKNVFLSNDNTSLCALLLDYLSKTVLKLGDNHFLFTPIEYDCKKNEQVIKNMKLSYSTYRSIVKKAVSNLGIDPKDFSTHSCRAGGATDLAPYISQYELLLTGRWADPRSIGSYVETPDERRFQISKTLNLNFQQN